MAEQDETQGQREDKPFIPVHEGPNHGYWGRVMDDTPDHAYTVAGVTGAGTANVSDKPSPAHESRARKNTEALKGT